MSAIRVFIEDWKRHRHSGLRVMFVLTLYRFGRFGRRAKMWPFRKTIGLIYTILHPICALLSGLYLFRETKLGDAPHFIHGGNIQINPNVKIGARVGIMHGVTLGTGPDRENGEFLVPMIGDDCFLGANCTVLGGITIGDGSVVSANSLVLSDVPPGSLAIGVPAKVVPRALFETKQAA